MNKLENQDERRFRTLEAIHNEAVDAIITINPSGVIDSVNPATESMFGYQANELIGQNVSILMPAPDRENHDKYLENYQRSGERKIIGIGREVTGKRKDGGVFPVHLAVNEITVGREKLFAGVIRDLTEFKKLEAQETSLGRIIEDSLNEIFIFDAKTLLFVQVNHGARENLGYELEELRAMTPIDIKADFDEIAFRDVIAPLLEGEMELLELETVHQRKNGTTYPVEVHLQRTSYQGQAVFVAMVLDITAKMEAEKTVQRQRAAMQAELEDLVESRTSELRETQAELVRSEKFSTLGKVSGGIAHEIRNPLNAVKTSAYYLLNAKSATPEKVREHLERIDRQVTMIDNVVTALSDVAKLPEAELQPAEVDRMLKSVVSTMDFPNNVGVKVSVPNALPMVLADENQIVIAIKNLLRNAREAMEVEGGTLSISAQNTERGIEIHVDDTGCGISSEHMDLILEPLFTTKARGMGLGLSITRAIVEKNKGALEVCSELGKGSRFTITLTAKMND